MYVLDQSHCYHLTYAMTRFYTYYVYSLIHTQVSVSTGIITTIAGTGSAGSSGDGSASTNALLFNPYGVAVDSSGNVYIADYTNHKIRKVSR